MKSKKYFTGFNKTGHDKEEVCIQGGGCCRDCNFSCQYQLWKQVLYGYMYGYILGIFVLALTPGPKGHVSYCHHVVSITIVNFFKNLLWNQWRIYLILGSYGLWYIDYKVSLFLCDPIKNMAAVAKNRTWGSKSSFSQLTQKWKQI